MDELDVFNRETTFGQVLRELRTARGLTQEELAERARVSARAISDLERGERKRPRKDTVELLANSLNLDLRQRDHLHAAAHLCPARTARSNGRPRGNPTSEGSIERELHNLPTPLTRLIGREGELDQLTSQVRHGRSRLVTVVGPGGVGKTRLAIDAANGLVAHFPDGVWLVDLAPLNEAELVASRVARAIGLQEGVGGVAASTLARALRSRQVLIVLDNCEHLAEACARLIQVLLEGSTAPRVLATSQEPMGIAGETVWRLPPLETPVEGAPLTIDDLARYPSVHLFLDRATAASPSFRLTPRNREAVASICRHLDGIPLAIELAAARVAVLPPEQISERLDQRFRLLTSGSRSALPRQRTLAAAIDWSYSLLNLAERTAFRRLSVFAGGFDLDAVEAVAATTDDDPDPNGEIATIHPDDVLDLFDRLVDRSMVVAEEDSEGRARFRLLESLKQYGQSKLDELGANESCRARHAFHYHRLAGELSRHIDGPKQKGALERLQLEHDNLRAALTWLIEHNHPTAAHQLAQALVPFWTWFRFLGEAADNLERVLALTGAAPATRGETLVSAVSFALLVGRAREAEEYRNELDRLAQELNTPHLRARAQLLRTLARLVSLSEEELVLELGAAERLARASGDDATVSAVLLHLGLQQVRYGRVIQAREVLAESVALNDRRGNRLEQVLPLTGQSNLLALFTGDLAAARASAERAVAIANELTTGRGNADALEALGMVALLEGSYDEAGAYLRRSLRVRRDVADWPLIGYSLDRLAVLASLTGQSERAVRLGAAAAKLRPSARATFARAWQPRLDAWLDDARNALGGPDSPLAQRARATGEVMSLDEAIDDALDVPEAKL